MNRNSPQTGHLSADRRLALSPSHRSCPVGYGSALVAARPRPSYGSEFRSRVEAMKIAEVIRRHASPWQNAYVERVIDAARVR
jgi:hypothetical protein